MNPERQHWQLFILVHALCSIIFALVVTPGLHFQQGNAFEKSIKDHRILFKELYQDLIPKHHLIVQAFMVFFLNALKRPMMCEIVRIYRRHWPTKNRFSIVLLEVWSTTDQ